MKTWIITDTHFGHTKLCELTNRPQNFTDIIFKSLKQIAPNDVVIHLGDFCIGEDAKWHQIWRETLPTQKLILVRGNHDKKSNSWYLEHGWDFVCDRIDDHFFGKFVTLSHKPIIGVQNLNIHGHTHGSKHHDKEFEGKYTDSHKEFALEIHGLRPQLIEHFI